MRCTQCSSENPGTNRFCGQCGSRLSEIQGQEPVRRVPDTVSNSHPAPTADSGSVLREVAVAGDQRDAVQSDWFSERPASKPNPAQITGPSFLGLGESDAAQENVTYLYEDDPPGHARFFIAALMTVALLAFVGYEWHANPELSHGVVDRISQIWNANTAKESPPPAAAASPLPPDKQTTGPQVTGTETEAAAVATAAANQQEAPQPASSPDDSQKTEAVGSTESAAPAKTANDADPGPTTNDQPKQDSRRQTKKSVLPVATAPEKRAASDAAILAQADNYLYGRGVARDCNHALDYLRTAADRGDAGARSKLGGLYATGNCVPFDRVRAYNWFVLARRAGDRNVWVDQNITMLWNAMSAQEKALTIPAR